MHLPDLLYLVRDRWSKPDEAARVHRNALRRGCVAAGRMRAAGQPNAANRSADSICPTLRVHAGTEMDISGSGLPVRKPLV